MHAALSRAPAVAPAQPRSSLPAAANLPASRVSLLRRSHSVRLTRALRADVLRRAVSSNYHVACESGTFVHQPFKFAGLLRPPEAAITTPALCQFLHLSALGLESSTIRGLVRFEDATPWLSVVTIPLLEHNAVLPGSITSHRTQLAASATMSPNPSVERTANGGQPLFASTTSVPPLSASHLKR